jgi:protein-tyrosine-phosphatase
MAKAITEQLLVGRKLKHPVDIYAVGLVPKAKQASYGAQQAIKEMYNADLLKDHKPVTFTEELVDKADLILMMDKKLFNATKDRLPQNKTYILKEFFGESGDVANPWRPWGGRDPKTLERYRTCAAELKQILSTHLDTLLNALGAV